MARLKLRLTAGLLAAVLPFASCADQASCEDLFHRFEYLVSDDGSEADSPERAAIVEDAKRLQSRAWSRGAHSEAEVCQTVIDIATG